MIDRDNKASVPEGLANDNPVKMLLDKINTGIKRRERELGRWNKIEKFRRLKQWHGAEGKGDQVTVNKFGAWLRDQRASIAFNNPRVRLTPKSSDGYDAIDVPVLGEGGQVQRERGPGGEPVAVSPAGEDLSPIITRSVQKHKVREAIINDILAHPLQGMQATSGRLVEAGYTSYGVIKTTYRPHYETRYEPDREQTVPLDSQGRISMGSRYVTSPIDGSLIRGEDGRLLERDMIPAWEDWRVDWVNPRRLIIDPDGGNDDTKHEWICEEIIRPLESVKNDPLYKNTDGVKPTWCAVDDESDYYDTPSTASANYTVPQGHDGQNKMVRLFEFYDIRNRRIKVLADGHDKMLRDAEYPRGLYNHPYAFFRPDEILGEFYQQPRGADLVPINEALNHLYRMEYLYAQRAVPKTYGRKGALDPKAKSALSSDEPWEHVEVDTSPHPGALDEAIRVYNPPSSSVDIDRSIDRLERAFDEAAGNSRASRGQLSGSTATEVRTVEQGEAVREAFDRAVLAETFRVMAKKLDDSVQADMTMSRAVRLQDSDGQAFVGQVEIEMILGDMDVEIDVEDLGPENDALQLSQFIQMQQVVAQNPFPWTQEAFTRGACSMAGIKDERFIQALVDGAQMQVEFMQMQAAPPSPSPEGGVPASEADLAAQTAAGTQTPRMSGAT